mgnify:FL=1
MSGADVVQQMRQRLADRKPDTDPALLRKRLVAGAIALSLVAFGTLVVRAADESSVYEVNRQVNRARDAVRSVSLPSIFMPQRRQPVMTTALSYAPVFDSLMPGPSAGNRALASPSPRKDPSEARKSKDRSKSQEEFAKSYIKSRTSYCVRSCDGFFYPVGNPDSGEIGAHEAACERTCPGAETEVYVAAAGSSGIADAINRRGQRYEALKTAFNHRTQIDSACSCNGAIGAPRNHSVMSDFTLRKGDMVMSREGLRIFRGTATYPHRVADFARPDAVKMSAGERQAVQRMEASAMRGMSGARLSPSLKARISAQIEASRPVGVSAKASNRTASLTRQVTGVDGRSLRYVGPDSSFDRAR